MKILAIDPGNEKSAWVEYGESTIGGDIEDNEQILSDLKQRIWEDNDKLVIEMIASYGMPVGATVFETCVWIGRFIEAWDGPYELVYRKDVKMHICGTTKAKDSNIRQAIIDMYGGKTFAIGKKATPGPLYGFKADMWAALAVAITYIEITGAEDVSK